MYYKRVNSNLHNCGSKPIKKKQWRSLSWLKLLTPLTVAQALQFNFTYAPGTTLDQMLGYEMAGKYWSNYLSDDVTLNIFIEPTNMLPTNVIGGSIPGVTNESFSQVKAKLKQDITSATDRLAVDKMYSKLFGFDALTTTYIAGLGITNSTNNINKINLTRANAKALGMINSKDSGYDAYILVSNLGNLTKPLSWNYFSGTNSSNTIPTGTLDFFSVAVHELTHTLGFISGIDSPEYAALLTQRFSLSSIEMYKYGYLMDMFRLSGNSLKNNSKPDISIGVDTILSIDGGKTKLGEMSSGSSKFGGDGNQGSHWNQDATYDGIMEATLSAGGTRKAITNNDLTVLDAIGWDIQPNNQDLLTIFNSAKSGLASKMGVTDSWIDANPTQAALRLTPGFIDANKNGYDDRGEALNKMVNGSGTYNWGWNNYWWGWNGYWWGWNGYWQSSTNLTADGFWQNAAWETLDEFTDGQHDHDHDNFSSYSQTQSVPEPTTISGLLGMALLGMVVHLKRRCLN
jgi:PEP-CTERM motif